MAIRRWETFTAKTAVLAATGETFEEVAERRKKERSLALEFAAKAPSADEIARLKSKVGEITMDNELLYAKIAAMEGKRPLARRRSRR